MTDRYSFDRVQELATKKWPRFEMEYDLIPRKMAEHLARGYQLIH